MNPQVCQRLPATHAARSGGDADAGLRRVAEAVAVHAYGALLAELYTWPKPGLVSPVDSGSHR